MSKLEADLCLVAVRTILPPNGKITWGYFASRGKIGLPVILSQSDYMTDGILNTEKTE